MPIHTPTCRAIDLGVIDYEAAWALQHRLAAARGSGALADDVLLLLEHPHTYTLGRSADRANLLFDAEARTRRGIALVESDRGGDITYHGPGQLVAYPIRYLGKADPSGRLTTADYVGYLRRLEGVLIATLAGYGVRGYAEAGYTGVWVATADGPAKVAAIGVRVTAAGVSLHGCALNVNTDLAYFAGIIPCGINDRPVTSLAMLLGGKAPPLDAVKRDFTAAFGEVFGAEMQPTTLDELPGGPYLD